MQHSCGFFGRAKGQSDKDTKTEKKGERKRRSRGSQRKKNIATVCLKLAEYSMQKTSPRGPGATREGVCELNVPVSLDDCVQDKSPVVFLSQWALTKTNSHGLK